MLLGSHPYKYHVYERIVKSKASFLFLKIFIELLIYRLERCCIKELSIKVSYLGVMWKLQSCLRDILGSIRKVLGKHDYFGKGGLSVDVNDYFLFFICSY